jgi:AraC family transcriptional regulator, transcriptional activator of the genes for pyochelin and ferripyochelin receptors
MTVPASKICVSPANAEEFGRKLSELISPERKDAREGSFDISGPVTSGKFEVCAIRPGLRLFAFDMQVSCDAELHIEAECSGVVLWLVLGGRCGCITQHHRRRKELWELQPGRNVLGTFQPDKSSWLMCGGDFHRGVELQIDAAIAAQLIAEYREAAQESSHPLLMPPDDVPRYVHSVLSPQLATIANQVLTCPFDGFARHLFMESKALEILALQLDGLTPSSCRQAVVPSRAERERLEEARRILDDEYPDPPSLGELARRVGLNDFKLKRGFKALFETTVYGYVRRVRMKNALNMLQGSSLNVGEVAAAAGYSCFSHFSIAFRKQFGISPRDVKKGRSKNN